MSACASALVGLLLFLGTAPSHSEHLEVISEWRTLTFDFPHDFPVQSFIPENNVFSGVTVTEDRIFLAVPRLRAGVPATLGWIPRGSRHEKTKSPMIRAFPNWSWHNRAANCSGIISVFRTRVDDCNRLWVLDSGVTTTLEDFTVLCPPKLLVFDLSTDTLLRSITFPPEVIGNKTLMTNLVLEQDGGDDVIVYMCDTVDPGIVVYNSAQDTMWRISHPAMEPEPQYSTVTIVGESFDLADGIIGLALSPPSNHRLLYFQPLATDRLFAVPTAALRGGPPPAGQLIPVIVVGYKSSQGMGLTVDSRGNIYFSPASETALVSYDPRSEHTKLLAYSPARLQFVSDILIPNDGTGDIYMTSTRFQKYFRRTLDVREVNLRVLRVRASHSRRHVFGKQH